VLLDCEGDSGTLPTRLSKMVGNSVAKFSEARRISVNELLPSYMYQMCDIIVIVDTVDLKCKQDFQTIVELSQTRRQSTSRVFPHRNILSRLVRD